MGIYVHKDVPGEADRDALGSDNLASLEAAMDDDEMAIERQTGYCGPSWFASSVSVWLVGGISHESDKCSRILRNQQHDENYLSKSPP